MDWADDANRKILMKPAVVRSLRCLLSGFFKSLYDITIVVPRVVRTCDKFKFLLATAPKVNTLPILAKPH